MPKDKTNSHKKIVEVALQEFLEKGYEKVSMKDIADKVGMTSAGLYRHFDNKEDMFKALVQPAVEAIENWRNNHVVESKRQMSSNDTEDMWGIDGNNNDARMILDVMYQNPDLFYLLLFKSQGTIYENYLHDFIDLTTDTMMSFLKECKKNGYHPQEISRNEMHMLISAYTSALIQPIEHGYTKKEAEEYFQTVLEFFTPGWRKVTGL